MRPRWGGSVTLTLAASLGACTEAEGAVCPANAAPCMGSVTPAAASSSAGGAPATTAASTAGATTSGGAGGASSFAMTFDEPEDGTYALPSWLAYASPTPGRTSQVGPSTVQTGYPPDVPRARNVGVGWGLSLEPRRTNLVPTQDFRAWLDGGATVAEATGPDGMPCACELADDDAQQKTFVYTMVDGYAVGQPHTLSAFTQLLPPAPPPEGMALVNPNQGGPPPIQLYLVDEDWTRRDSTGAAVVPSSPLAIDPRLVPPSDTGAVRVWGLQMEAGEYPTSVIPTDGAPATREADSLWSPAVAEIAPGGWFHASIVLAPSYAWGEAAGRHDLLYFDADHRVSLEPNGVVSLVIAGDALATKQLTWVRNQVIAIDVRSTPDARSISVAVQGGTADAVSAPPASALPAVEKLFLLGDAGGAQEAADLRSLAFLPP